MNLLNILAIVTVIVTILIFTERSCAKALSCTRCPKNETIDPFDKVCIWGENIDCCKRRVCSKGPGEKCGEQHDVKGVCGEGMWCSKRDFLCHGCFLATMACFKEWL